jgi:hypothetical protein
MARQVELSEDGRRALRESENYCWRSNVAIVAPEHLLAGALLVLAGAGTPDLPSGGALQRAVAESVGLGDSMLADNVMFGPGARAVVEAAIRGAAEAAAATVDARALARAAIASGEVKPAFFMALGVSKDELLRVLG